MRPHALLFPLCPVLLEEDVGNAIAINLGTNLMGGIKSERRGAVQGQADPEADDEQAEGGAAASEQ